MSIVATTVVAVMAIMYSLFMLYGPSNPTYIDVEPERWRRNKVFDVRCMRCGRWAFKRGATPKFCNAAAAIRNLEERRRNSCEEGWHGNCSIDR
jgi:hypothetical protein